MGAPQFERAIGIGLDFGTTNSSLAIATGDGAPELAVFPTARGATPSFRSVLFFGREDDESPIESAAGPMAIERYLEMEGERRLVQSLKSFLASRSFSATRLFGRRTTLEHLVTGILNRLLESREAGRARLAGPVVVGRPVRFAKSQGPADDDFAVERLRQALAGAGLESVVFEYEPVAAAYHYERDLDHEELVLIADFGGGTSDFCLLRVGPEPRRNRGPDSILGTEGVALAGDAFDARIVRERVAPRLGRGGHHVTPYGDRVPVPNWIYRDLERWHHLSFLRTRKTLGLLYEIRKQSQDPTPIDALIHIVENDLGYALYRSVERAKTELSVREETRLRFAAGPVEIDTTVSRPEFESWIASELDSIRVSVDRLLHTTGASAGEVDRVFLTGGSSFVPAVRRIFEQRFGADRLRTGGELISVASGLALRARDLARSGATGHQDPRDAG
ncbi:MAG: Hsp70 family protein [Myxococcota bacterium]